MPFCNSRACVVGRHIGTTSFDHTWRLWDIETGQLLLLQVCYSNKMHRLDLSGKSIHLMQASRRMSDLPAPLSACLFACHCSRLLFSRITCVNTRYQLSGPRDGRSTFGGAGGSEDEWLEFTYTTLLTPALTHIHKHVHIFIGIH